MVQITTHKPLAYFSFPPLLQFILFDDVVIFYAPSKSLSFTNSLEKENGSWKLVLACGLILRYSFINGSEDGWTSIHSDTLKRFLGTRDYRRILNLLEDNKIIEADNNYKVGSQSRRYRIKKKWRDDIQEVRVKSRPLVKQLLPWSKQSQSTTLSAPHQWVTDCLRKVAFDADGAKLEMENTDLSAEARDYWERVINQFDAGLFYSKATSTGRLSYSVASLPRQLRKHLYLPEEDALCEIDVKCCQPFLLCFRYALNVAEHSRERRKFTECVLNDFYQQFADQGDFDRDEVKKDTYIYILFGKNRSQNILWQRFKKQFPILASRIVFHKEHTSNSIALYLQRQESERIFGKVVAKLMGKTFCLTVHDSVICKSHDRPMVEALIKAAFCSPDGIEPELSCKTYLKYIGRDKDKSIKQAIPLDTFLSGGLKITVNRTLTLSEKRHLHRHNAIVI